MAAHKYLTKDVRYKGRELLEERSYFRHFPIPRLRRLHHTASKACQLGAFRCLQEINSKVEKFNTERKSGSNIYHPFYNKVDLFQYRTTASYFLCMYTLERNAMMKTIHMAGKCLDGFQKTREAKESGVFVNDWRKDDVEYQCSQIYYCPNPCYGRQSQGNIVSFFKQWNDPGNPCRDLKNQKCSWAPGRNSNFESLMRNRFNITCICTNDRKGFAWNSRFKMCVDIDECHNGNVVCEKGKMCQNTAGSYVCVCPRGKMLNKKTQKCEDIVLLPEVKKAKSKQRINRNDKPTLLRQLEILLGVSSAATAGGAAGWPGVLTLSLTLIMIV
ncbi:uncharacterized protein LOC124280879 [Haliotis rubra]|uniref:uncharacterized protein LOC124280879 n=1 Tax=Haliotis rubra TaxID=36100 RepID=UPI001EE526C1|nr:uncharacterized protein LOC124280879 [Haliotis rubra]